VEILDDSAAVVVIPELELHAKNNISGQKKAIRTLEGGISDDIPLLYYYTISDNS
jgi:hypothetical protein